jgi:ABC-type multidrug transport system ATPase subunit
VVRVAGATTVDTAHPPPPGTVGLLPQDATFRAHMPMGRQLTHYAELAGMSRAAAESDARAALQRVGLAGSWGTRPRSLSHGMGKRVAIAQAILGDPRLVILDEPTAGLDPHAARELKAVLRVLREGRTIIVSSHNLAEIEDLCHEVAILHRGQVVRHDSVSGLVGSAAELGLRLALPPTQAQFDSIRRLPWSPISAGTRRRSASGCTSTRPCSAPTSPAATSSPISSTRRSPSSRSSSERASRSGSSRRPALGACRG